ncbi:hypothetical protein B0J12DRAFT_415117 [Macrophomina phaseolina]|uniref:Secreted protein n=1 Tax=Macrophomina phaseolina TaxID=35725 RepID=A0ABQ8FRS8_9PEZI|nr:hypothetical protein B0J12DRAFT_415117 [Macrophomina phaseolina]
MLSSATARARLFVITLSSALTQSFVRLAAFQIACSLTIVTLRLVVSLLISGGQSTEAPGLTAQRRTVTSRHFLTGVTDSLRGACTTPSRNNSARRVHCVRQRQGRHTLRPGERLRQRADARALR